MAYTLKVAKQWFLAHPTCKVVFHRRWEELSTASRERLSMPRDVRIVGTRAQFSDGSVLPLRTDDNTSSVTPGGLLDIFDGAGRIIVTYAPA